MQEWSKVNKGYRYILDVIDCFSKYAWGISLKDKKGETVLDAFKHIVKTSDRKPAYIWVDEGKEFYNKDMTAWLKKEKITRYSTHGEHKSAIAERFNRTLKGRMWHRFTAGNTRNWIDMLDDLRGVNYQCFEVQGSTTSALIVMLSTITTMLETQPYVRVIALDFSKAFDSVRHCKLVDKMSLLYMPDSILNWIIDFLSERTHRTTFNGETSSPASISASVIQGSVIGPAAYLITASDLRPEVPGNEMFKFADDSYLIVPGANSSSCDSELEHINRWSSDNNLQLNRKKSTVIIFYGKNSRVMVPMLPDIPRVRSMRILGVVVKDDLNFDDHIGTVINSSARSLHAMRLLKSQGLSAELLQMVFTSLILAKLLHCSPAWWGFLRASERDRLEGFMRRSKQSGFCPPNHPSVAELCQRADQTLFESIVSNPEHVLYKLLPPKTSHGYNLRKRQHDFVIPSKKHYSADFSRNFIIRMLFENSY